MDKFCKWLKTIPHKYFKWFNFFKKEKKQTPHVYDGRFISEDEITEMVKPKTESFIKKGFRDIEEMMDKLRKSIPNG